MKNSQQVREYNAVLYRLGILTARIWALENPPKFKEHDKIFVGARQGIVCNVQYSDVDKDGCLVDCYLYSILLDDNGMIECNEDDIKLIKAK